ncbi:MAG: hypothetical protein LBQ54_01415 [Planctomycetaceae bacterium]|nr:hypothetical protein [Planctomycetaceae bacterium]
MPPAGRDAAAGDRLTLTPFGSPSVGKIFPTEAEGKLRCNGTLPRSRCSLESTGGTGKGRQRKPTVLKRLGGKCDATACCPAGAFPGRRPFQSQVHGKIRHQGRNLYGKPA